MGVNVADEHPKEASESSSVKFHSPTSASRLAIVPLRLFKSRSKSQSRVTSAAARSCWVPDGNCLWRDNAGHFVQLKDVNLLDIIEPERTALQRLAISKLNDINLGCHVELPKTENVPVHHSKRRPMLLRKKAATTNFFEGKEKDKGLSGRGAMFGISLAQCVANDRMRLAEENVHRQDHCEEVLSALRISLKEEEKSMSSREGSQTDIRGSENQGSTESLTWLEPSDSSDMPSQKRSASRSSTSSLYGSGGSQVPNIVDNCISFLENKGLHTLGIFRVSGSKKRIRQLREDLDTNPSLTFNDSSQPHDVAQLLKEFFRELPEPLLTRDLYKAFIEIQKLRDPQRRLEAMRWLLYLLPVVHRDTLAALLSFLSKVADSSEDYHRSDGTRVNGNKMNSNNLATVFGPNILRSSKGSSGETTFSVQSSDKAQDRSDVILTVRSLIDNYKALFQVPARELDSAYHNLMTEDPELLNALLYRHLSISASETKKETESSSSSQYHSEKTSDQSSALHTTQRSAREIFFSKEMTHKQSHYSPDMDVRSRIRPLMFPGTGYTDHSQSERVQHRETKLNLKTTQGSTVTELTSHQYGVSASFTVTRSSGGSSPVPELKIYESEHTASSSRTARRVPYGKVRHLTTPSYISEEMSITITIPSRKQTQRYPTNETQSLTNKGILSWSGSHSSFVQNAQGSSKTDKRVQTKSKASRQYLCPPAPQEIWKRQELIASEHTQL